MEEIITHLRPVCGAEVSVCKTVRRLSAQTLSYEKQLEFKTSKVGGHLERIGGFIDIPMEKILGMGSLSTIEIKRSFQLESQKTAELLPDFMPAVHSIIIENRDCALGVTRNKEVLDRVIAHMEKFHIQPYDENTGKGLVRHVLIRYGFLRTR